MIEIEPETPTYLPRWQPTPDDRSLRIGAWAVALAGHAMLFGLYIPSSSPPTPPPPVRAIPFTLAPMPPPAPPPPEKPPERTPRPQEVRRSIPGPPAPTPEPIEVAPTTLAPVLELPAILDVFPIPESPPPEEPATIRRVTGEVHAPVPLEQPEPRYTEMARRHRVEGLVILEAIIDPEGRVTDVQVLRGLPMGLEQEAISAVRRWRYEPATLHGEPIPVVMAVTVSFRLR